ncbi:YciI family protein [Actinocorallia sp. API 0066]|uniref:YciI family protein n=1 Tax=Actinocorallia sp. API 0066 TaxID=2896846 RepID=UPI001E5F0301|nr:YciI family protein [Actinocorallia sp. API 0066]MCD0451770.1 YciI family protein [Actinocorallia sp. API 0066]
MEFFCYHRDRAGSRGLRKRLVEEHWAYMDGFADTMIARGPTFGPDGPTGSVHLLGLPDAAAARAFAFDEPGYQAGAYRDVMLRRWRNTLGRTMWDHPMERDAEGHLGLDDAYLVIGLGSGDPADLTPPSDASALVAHGPLLSDDAAAWLGTAALVQASDPRSARALLTPDRYASIDVHPWTPGGRPAPSL